MISFQIKKAGKCVEIDCDASGLSILFQAMEEAKSGGTGHIHLRAPSAGGKILSDTTPWGEETVSEVIISLGGD